MLRKLALILAMSPAMWLSQALALGLGDIDVTSQLNQRFSATIPLTDVSLDEAETLQVGLASNESYVRRGLDRADYLSTLNFKVQTDNGAPRIVITSKQIAREPTFNLLVDVMARSGRVQREFTVLLDPPDYALNKSTAPETVATEPESAPQAATPVPAQKKSVAPGGAEKAAPPRSYGPVAAGETLWHVATQLRRDPKITMDQMQWALYRANPDAFEGGDIGKLMKGARLKVPAEATIRSVSPQKASKLVRQQRGEHRTAPPPETKKQPASKPAAEPTTQVAPPAEMPKAPESPKAAAAPEPPKKPDLKKPETPPAKPAEPQTVKPVVVAPQPASAPAMTTPAASEVHAMAPVSAAVATTPAAASHPVVEAASAVAPTMEAASQPATASAVETQPASVVQTEPAPVKPYIPPPIPPMPEDHGSLMEEWGDQIKLGGGVVILLGLLGYLLLSRKAQPQAPKAAAPKKPFQWPKLDWQFWKKKAEALEKPVSTKPSKTAPAVQAAFDESDFEREYAASAKQAPAVTPTPPAPRKGELPPNDTAQLPNFDSTQIFDTPPDVPVPAINTDAVDFDVTGKFEAETLKIDLNDNDPLAEADFHLAYGLYDEAALQLKQAAQKEPGRTDIPLKLAEVYFRAGKAADFQLVAESLKPKLPAAEWSKIALMGKQLSPDAPLYQGADTDVLTTDMDIAFDEPVATSSVASVPQPSKPAVDVAPLEFDLKSLEMPKLDLPSSPATKDVGNTLEFNLDDFKLDTPAPSAPAAPPAKAAAADAPMEFDLSSFDLGPAETPAADSKSISVDDIKLDDFDLGHADDSHAISTGDEASTKLDLARAYVDMGDNEMARSLLTEVLQQGSDSQKKEAQTLLGRLA